MKKFEYKVVAVRYEKKIDEIGRVNSIYKDGIGIGCNDGEVVITEFIPSGKKQMLVSSYLNGIDKKYFLNNVIGVPLTAKVKKDAIKVAVSNSFTEEEKQHIKEAIIRTFNKRETEIEKIDNTILEIKQRIKNKTFFVLLV